MVCRVFLCISCSYLFVRFSQFAFFPSSLRSPAQTTITCGLGGEQKEEEQTCLREAFRTSIVDLDRSSPFPVFLVKLVWVLKCYNTR